MKQVAKKRAPRDRSAKNLKRSKMIAERSSDNNTSRDMELPRCIWLEDYPNFFSGKLVPVNEGFLEFLGKELIEYSKKSLVLNLEMFFLDKGMEPATASRWAKKYPIFGVYYNAAKMYLGIRREHGALTKELSEKMVLHSIHRYLPEYREDGIFHAQMKQTALSNLEGPRVIVLDKLFDDKKD